jgi:hypothetical protein
VRVTFLTGGLEPGKDGVGDYTRLLASECARQGANCQAIALVDRHVGRLSRERQGDVEFTRLPASAWRSTGFASVVETIRSFGSDWVSLQFVPYSFQRWGLPVRLVRTLPEAVVPARLHLMLHEIWTAGGGSWRRRIVSRGQRQCVLALCRRADGVHAGLLPLFGNVPVSTADAMAWLAPALSEIGCDAAARRVGWWLCVLFGTGHPEWTPEPLMSRLQQAAAGHGRRVGVISVGRLGVGESMWEAMRSRYQHDVPMLRLGEQPAERISELLNTADFGIATSPYALLEKSGTVTAMLEHGLPVIVNRLNAAYGSAGAIDTADADLVIRMDTGFAHRLSAAARRRPESRLPAVARQLLADLERATRTPWSS